MKKSHRKDVIIARIVFALFCLIIIAIVVGIVMFFKSRIIGQREPQKESQTESEYTDTQKPLGSLEDDIIGGTSSENESQIPDTQNTQDTQDTQDNQMPGVDSPIPVLRPLVRTTTGVNLRSEPNKNCDVIMVLDAGTVLEIIGEENGWAYVEYMDKSGYVSMDYLKEVAVDEDSDN